MQKRKEMHCGRGGLAGAAAALLFSLGLAVASPVAAVGDLFESDRAAAGGVLSPERRALRAPLGEQRYGGAFVSLSNPYMLENFAASSILVGVRTPGWSVWVRWFHLGHPLYREDRLALSLGSSMPVRGLSVHVVPGVDRREVRGFPSLVSRSLALALIYRGVRCLEIRARGTPFEGERGVRQMASVSIALRGRAFSASFDRVLAGDEAGDARLGLEAALHDAISLEFGYRSMTDGILAGLVIRVRPMIIGLSWSYHPALGKTISVDFGRWWAW